MNRLHKKPSNISVSIIGGVQRRYITLYNYISEKRKDYCLIINNSLYVEAIKKQLLGTNKNIFIINLSDKSKKKLRFSNIKKRREIIKPKRNANGIFLILGQYNSFLKLFFKWLIFAFQFIYIVKK